MSYFKGNPVFNSIPNEAKISLCDAMQYEFYDTKEIILKELHTMRKFYFIESGVISMSRLNGHKITYEKYDVIGEPLLLLWAKQQAGGEEFSHHNYVIKTRYVASSCVRVWTIDYEAFVRIFRDELSKDDRKMCVNLVLELYQEFIKDIAKFNGIIHEMTRMYEKTHAQWVILVVFENILSS